MLDVPELFTPDMQAPLLRFTSQLAQRAAQRQKLLRQEDGDGGDNEAGPGRSRSERRQRLQDRASGSSSEDDLPVSEVAGKALTHSRDLGEALPKNSAKQPGRAAKLSNKRQPDQVSAFVAAAYCPEACQSTEWVCYMFLIQ